LNWVQREKRGWMNTWVLEEEPRRALAREPRGFWEEDEEEEGSGQEVAPVIRSRIAITNYLTFLLLLLLFESKFNFNLINEWMIVFVVVVDFFFGLVLFCFVLCFYHSSLVKGLFCSWVLLLPPLFFLPSSLSLSLSPYVCVPYFVIYYLFI
jgi:hypothetical protein